MCSKKNIYIFTIDRHIRLENVLMLSRSCRIKLEMMGERGKPIGIPKIYLYVM